MTQVTVADLRPIDLFDELDDDELGEWAAVATVRDVGPGVVVAEQGLQPPGLQLLLEGVSGRSRSTARPRSPSTARRHRPGWARSPR